MRTIIAVLLALTMSATASAKLTYDALVRSAKIYMQQTPKDYASAQAKLEEAIREYPDKPPIEAWMALGAIHADKGRFVEMNLNFDAALKVCGETEDKKLKKLCEKDKIINTISTIKLSEWINQFNDGAQTLSKAKEQKDGLADVSDSDEVAEIHEEIKEMYRQALQSFINSTIIIPDSASGWINLGIAYYNLGDKDSAIYAYDKATELSPGNVDLLSNKATIFFEMENWQRCAETFGRMAELQPDVSSWLINLYLVLNQLGQTDSAMKVLDKVVDVVDPENAEMRTQRAFFEIKLGADVNDSINTLKKQGESENSGQIKALTVRRNDYYKQVVKDFTKVVEVGDPADTTKFDAYYYLGLCYYFLEDYNKSRDSWLKAVELRPDDAEVWELLAPLHLKLGDAEKAQAAQKKAEELRKPH